MIWLWPCGKIRLRPAGSSGGHNGLKDIERVLGTASVSKAAIRHRPIAAKSGWERLCAREIYA